MVEHVSQIQNIEKLLKEVEKDLFVRVNEIDPFDNENWSSMVFGWAIGKGLDPASANVFATFITYTGQFNGFVIE